MRLKYYKLYFKNKRNLKKKIIVFFIFLFIILSFIFFLNNNLEPKVLALCDTRAKSIAVKTTNTVIQEKFSSLDYSDLVNLKQDENGKVIAINADVIKLNKIASDVALSVQEELNKVEEVVIKYPIASLFFENIFSGYGPKLVIKVVPSGSVSVEFFSEFEDCGINQTRHKISINVKTNVRIIAPFFSKTNEYSDEITIAESVIVGDVPETYYNIVGVKDLQKESTFDFVGE